MKIWVVGSSGMVGSAILSVLKEKEIDCLATCRNEVDISSYPSIESFALDKRFSHIINCAAYTRVDEAETKEKEAFEVNGYGVEKLALFSEKVSAKLVHFSTDYVFSGLNHTPYQEELPSEREPFFPKTIYGKSKLLGEKLLLLRSKKGLIIRTSWLFGFRGKNFVKTMLEQFQTKSEVFVVDDQLGRPTFALDLAEVTLALLSDSGIFHFANDLTLSWYDFAKIILTLANKYKKMKCQKIVPISTQNFNAPARRPLYSVLSTKKIENHLHLEAPSLMLALEKYISTFFTPKILNRIDRYTLTS
jgi:dTDP-4-dehydrorhamnose reductase